MARQKRTREELEHQVRALEPYQEAYFCLAAGEKPVTLRSGEETIQVLGMHRACGGLVLTGERGGSVSYAMDWCQTIESRYVNPYVQELCSKVRRLMKESVERRYASR